MVKKQKRNHLSLWLILLILTAGCGTDRRDNQGVLNENLILGWTFPSGGAIHQSPLVIHDRVVIIPVGGPLMALDASTGRLSWQFDPPEGVWERAFASDGERLFVALKGGRFVALNAHNGEVLWQRDLGINSQSPPLVYQGTLYIPTAYVGPELAADVAGRAKLFALQAKTGKRLWVFETDNYILQTPERRNDTIYVGGNFADPREIEEGGHVRLYALDASDASVRWIYEAEDGFPKRLYATEETLIFVGYQDFINGIDATQGKLRWRHNTGNWTPSFLGAGDRIFLSSANTNVASLNANTGDILWEYNIPHGTFNYLIGAPAIDSGVLYFLTQQGDIIALDANIGTQRWRFASGVTAARAGLSLGTGWLYLGDAEGMVYGYTSPRSK